MTLRAAYCFKMCSELVSGPCADATRRTNCGSREETREVVDVELVRQVLVGDLKGDSPRFPLPYIYSQTCIQEKFGRTRPALKLTLMTICGPYC